MRNQDAKERSPGHLESWELDVLGVYDVVSVEKRTGLEEWFEFISRSSRLGMTGDICEFGVFRGRSLLGAALLLEIIGDSRRLVGFDTFNGFPVLAPEDQPAQFEALASDGAISENHLQRVRRNSELLELMGRSLDPLLSSSSGDFSTTSRSFVESRAIELGIADRIELFEGEFGATVHLEANSNRSISGVLLDADLYRSYRTVLPWAYPRLQTGGMIFLDEYFSLKFPGPRLAVNEFCQEWNIEPTLLRRDGAFERWAIIK